MVGEERDWIICTLEVVSLVVKGMDDCEQLTIIDIVVSFGRREGHGDVSAWVEVTIAVALHENSPTGKEGGIGHDDEGVLDIGEVKD